MEFEFEYTDHESSIITHIMRRIPLFDTRFSIFTDIGTDISLLLAFYELQ